MGNWNCYAKRRVYHNSVPRTQTHVDHVTRLCNLGVTRLTQPTKLRKRNRCVAIYRPRANIAHSCANLLRLVLHCGTHVFP